MNPARVACEGFSTDTRKALSIQCYTHVGVRAELNQLIFSTHEMKSNKHFEEFFLNYVLYYQYHVLCFINLLQ